ncbi:hypothetical protein BDY19DRAFT_990885 [Irpex rosettiformis]|uniref:Uncharacterized protein n=1 Tax=Irpex rosettiformis TaxID=378272 RepID=A0ACB8UCU9_9APHY|nr:hypothetical protein BDY19DRAFT_990885 [Irpex rosettiformis]
MSSNTEGLQIFVIDDSDPRLQYSGKWFVESDPSELHNATHGTSVPGSSVTFSFNGISFCAALLHATLNYYYLPGTFVSASATIDEHGVHYAYSLDGGEQTHANRSGTSPQLNNYPLFATGGLLDHEHNLTITSEVEPGETLWLDSISFTGHTLPPLPETAESSTVIRQPVHRISPGIIAAIVVGTLVGIVILVFVIFFASRRWHRLRMARPRHDTSEKRVAFEIAPSRAEAGEEPKTTSPEAVAAKWYYPLHGSRSAPSHGTTLPSSVFSSVIFNAGYSSSSSSRGTRSVF